MGEHTFVEWCHATINLWWGCTKVSAGCANCYAEAIATRWDKKLWGPGARRERKKGAEKLARKLERRAVREGRRLRVFCGSMSDWLDPEVPAEWLADLLALIESTPHLDWLLLTKRPELWRERLEAAANARPTVDAPGAVLAEQWLAGSAPPNVWLGTSIEDQDAADQRTEDLRKIPAAVYFASCEPLLGRVMLPRLVRLHFRVRGEIPFSLLEPGSGGATFARAGVHLAFSNPHGALCVRATNGSMLGIKPGEFEDLGVAYDWVIAGGESGPKARPMHLSWVRSLRDQCCSGLRFFETVNPTAFFFKQWGRFAPTGPVKAGRRYVCDSGHSGPFTRGSVEEHRRTCRGAGQLVYAVGKKAAGRELDGRTWDQVPGGAS